MEPLALALIRNKGGEWILVSTAMCLAMLVTACSGAAGSIMGGTNGQGDDGNPPGDDGNPPGDDGSPPGDNGSPPRDDASGGDANDALTLLFHSGFEPNTTVVNTSTAVGDLIGEDISVTPPNNWIDDLQSDPYVHSFRLYYGDGSGDASTRGVELVPDPQNFANQVLRFWILQPNDGVGTKGRIQADCWSDPGGFRNLHYSVRLYLPGDDFTAIMNLARAVNWFTLMEFWNHSPPAPESFRVTVDLEKPVTHFGVLRFGVRSESYDASASTYNRITSHVNTSFVVPVDKWMTLEINLAEGDETTGRFYMAVTPEGEERVIVFDEILRTYHTDLVPNGMHYFQPMKLYTYDWLIDDLRNQGKLTQVYWDDFAIYTGD